MEAIFRIHIFMKFRKTPHGLCKLWEGSGKNHNKLTRDVTSKKEVGLASIEGPFALYYLSYSQ
jgi:hypothetical protein